MGQNQSVRSTHFQRTTSQDDEPVEEMPDDHHISISNKMVERLVEDATLAVGAAVNQAVSPRGDYKEKMYIERLKCMDENHSQRTGLTMEDLKSLTNRIELRTANMVSIEPVCPDFKARVIECYNNFELPEDNFKCWDAVGEFRECVQRAGAGRLRARTRREAREAARRTRHAARARDHDLRDLAAPAL